jgi:malate dehydrogenase (oxaloacetate-decarboxylating)(NADP+)
MSLEFLLIEGTMPSPTSSKDRKALRGMSLLGTPSLNKGTAFTEAERSELGLEGLLPPAVETIDQQHQRVLQQLGQKSTNLGRYIYLLQLLDFNERLFYRVLMADPARHLPLVYNPTVGEACQKFGHIFRRPRGMYITIKQRGRVREVLGNWPHRDVRFICVSTGGRILGLGDLGANGMGIPIGKLQLYTACAAVPPQCLLPLLLDCGTDNRELLNDPLYLGLRQPRPSTHELDAFVEEFVQAVQEVFPRCCLHFEDWKGSDALRLLARYTDKVLCYNDDIQGTGSVVVAGLMNALRITRGRMSEQRVLFLGAGSAAIGIADMVASAMKVDGLSDHVARERIWMFDVDGLLEPSRTDLFAEQKAFAHPHAPTKDFLAAIQSLKPTVLVGVSTRGGAFGQQIIEALSRLNARPVIFALSNPTDRAECTAEEAYKWSRGKAVFAAGVQFPPVHREGETFVPSQANNLYIFPAISLAVYVTAARRVTNEMFIEAARATANQVSDRQREQGMLFPPLSNVLGTEVTTAAHVAEFIFEKGLARVRRPKGDFLEWIKSQLYNPVY